MPAHRLNLLILPQWELHKGGQQRHIKVRYAYLVCSFFCFVLSCLSVYLKCQFLIGPENLFLSLVWNSLDCLKIFCSSWSNWCGDSKSNSFISTI